MGALMMLRRCMRSGCGAGGPQATALAVAGHRGPPVCLFGDRWFKRNQGLPDPEPDAAWYCDTLSGALESPYPACRGAMQRKPPLSWGAKVLQQGIQTPPRGTRKHPAQALRPPGGNSAGCRGQRCAQTVSIWVCSPGSSPVILARQGGGPGRLGVSTCGACSAFGWQVCPVPQKLRHFVHALFFQG